MRLRTHYENPYLNGLIRDIKANGMCYIKSPKIANMVKEINPKIEVEYNEEDRSYTARYIQE